MTPLQKKYYNTRITDHSKFPPRRKRKGLNLGGIINGMNRYWKDVKELRSKNSDYWVIQVNTTTQKYKGHGDYSGKGDEKTKQKILAQLEDIVGDYRAIGSHYLGSKLNLKIAKKIHKRDEVLSMDEYKKVKKLFTRRSTIEPIGRDMLMWERFSNHARLYYLYFWVEGQRHFHGATEFNAVIFYREIPKDRKYEEDSFAFRVFGGRQTRITYSKRETDDIWKYRGDLHMDWNILHT